MKSNIDTFLANGVNSALSFGSSMHPNTRDNKEENKAFVKFILNHINDVVLDPAVLSNQSKSLIYRHTIESGESALFYEDKKWRGIITESSKCLSDDDSGLISHRYDILNRGHRDPLDPDGWSYLHHHSMYANLISKKVGWGDLIARLSSYIYNSSSTVNFMFSSWAEEDSESFVSTIESQAFGKVWTYKLRSVAYMALSSSGYLTKKHARKMRSDPSASSSVSGLKALISSRDKYENYDELLTQFMDTRYDEVAAELARNVPIHMLSFLMGSNFWYAKNIAEDRMNKFLENKDG